MEKTISINDKEFKFKSSAATNILYKKAFREDILVKLTKYTKDLKELRNMQSRLTELRADKDRPQEEVLAEMNTIMQSDIFISSKAFTEENLPKLAFIMYLEGNYKANDILQRLNEDSFILWMMSIEQSDILAMAGEIMTIWKAGAQTSSKPKN